MKFSPVHYVMLFIVALGLSMSANAADQKKDSPYYPSYATVKKSGHEKLTEDDWTDPRMCGQCHSRQYEGWNGSMHSNAFKDPVFQALWALAEKDPSVDTFNHCAGCHSPIGLVTDTIKFDPTKGTHGEFTTGTIASQGVSCDVCHTISGSNVSKTAVLEHGNGSFEMSPGNVKRATLKDAKSPFHETEYSPLHASSEFCGNCHNIFNPETNFPIERTYDEWKYSIYAQKGIQCMDCHMVPVEAAIEVADTLKRPEELKNNDLSGIAALGGPYRKVVHDHRFVGGNTVVTHAINGEDNVNYQDALKRLKSVASLEAKILPGANGQYNLRVKVTNERAGHNLPTSLTEVRQVWLEVIVTDDKGNELMRSGSLDEHNELPKDTVIFNAHAVDVDGKDTILPWKIAYFTEVNTIPPKGHKTGRYGFTLPASSNGVTVRARLHYRSFSQGLADMLLGKDKIHVSSVEMKAIERVFTKKEMNKVDHSNGH